MCWHIIIGWCYCHVEDVKPQMDSILFLVADVNNHWGWCYCLLYFYVIGWCYCQCVCGRCFNHYNTEADVFACYITLLLADVIAKTYVVDVMSTYCNMRRCYLTDVIAIYVCGRCYNHWGWCYCLLYFILFYYWLMLLPICGRCYSHFGVMWCIFILYYIYIILFLYFYIILQFILTRGVGTMQGGTGVHLPSQILDVLHISCS